MFIRFIIPILLCILRLNHAHAQENPNTFNNKIPDSLSVQSKDTDGDGVNDDADKCINEKGPFSNFGCPVIISDPFPKMTPVKKYIFFAAGTDRISSASVKLLKYVALILNENPTCKIYLEGYTDNIGNYEFNLKLSVKRAEAAKRYLLSEGIDKSRMTCKGNGEDKPMETNKTRAGRAKNNRVEITLEMN